MDGTFFKLLLELKFWIMNATLISKKENRTHNRLVNKSSTPFIERTIIQRKLNIGSANDAFETEADRVADQVIKSSDNNIEPQVQTGALLQRKCASCEEEEQLQKKPQSESISPIIQKSGTVNGNESVASEAVSDKINSSRGAGSFLGNDSRNFMETRIGSDFSQVKIHTDANAVQLSRALNAQAFTVGNDIYFNEGKYNPNSTDGKHLLAHELTHTVQQGGVQRKMINRLINCPANQNSSPNSPSSVLTEAKTRAATMALATSILLFIDSVTLSGGTFNSYLERFGIPPRASNKYANRFGGGGQFTNVDRAIVRELNKLSDRFKRVGNFLSGTIHFVCSGTNTITVGNCTHTCGTNAMAASCATGTHGRRIAICSGFWALASKEQRGAVIIHEAMHMLFRFGDRDIAPFANTPRRRAREPECYAGLAGDVYGASTGDPSCPKIAHPLISYWAASGLFLP